MMVCSIKSWHKLGPAADVFDDDCWVTDKVLAWVSRWREREDEDFSPIEEWFRLCSKKREEWMEWLDKKLATKFKYSNEFLVLREFLDSRSNNDLWRLIFEYLFDETELEGATPFSDWLQTKAVEWQEEEKKKDGAV